MPQNKVGREKFKFIQMETQSLLDQMLIIWCGVLNAFKKEIQERNIVSTIFKNFYFLVKYLARKLIVDIEVSKLLIDLTFFFKNRRRNL